jgi:type 2 lantibiotic biosynthesis protein LanM
MLQSFFKDPTWYQAMTLTERIASRRYANWEDVDTETNVELAQRRLRRWRLQEPFTSDLQFAQRLAMDGITEHEFLDLLGEPIEALRARFDSPPIWLAELEEAFSRSQCSGTIELPETPQTDSRSGFLAVIEPLIRQGSNRLREGVQTFAHTRADLPFDPGSIEKILLANLPWMLVWILSRTMVLELNVARLQGLLDGETPEQRFRSFLRGLSKPDTALAILQEYPVLTRLIMRCIANWVSFSLEFLRHLCSDCDAIRAMLSPDQDLGIVEELTGNTGDVHRGGRSVMMVGFSSGLKVVYKPKPLAVDVHFQELLEWLNDRGILAPFRTLKILNRDTYGWVEFVARQSCTSPDGARRFYERQGSYLAVLYALEATDFHYENLIAAGEHPVLIDLESLFHPPFGKLDLTQADIVANNMLANSVLRVLLLPERMWSNEESEGIDLSGIGAVADQISPDALPYWEGAATDAMRFGRKRRPLPGGNNRPALNGAEINVLDHSEAIIDGFTNTYRLLMTHRDELLSDSGPLARFKDDEVRVLLRQTRTYAILLNESFHPDVLRDALDRDRLLDNLYLAIEDLPHLARVVPAERKALENGDIPMFTTSPGSCDLWGGPDERIADFFDKRGMALVRQRIRQLSEKELSRQIWFIRASLMTLYMGHAKRTNYAPSETETLADRDLLLNQARLIGDRLDSLALHGDADATWIGLTVSNERYWSLAPLPLDLYNGTPGIVLFLSYLGDLTQQERYYELAQAGLKTMRQQIERGKPIVKSIGAFSGWGGIIYTLAHVGALWSDSELLAEAQGIVEILPTLIERDDQFDIIGGGAGCIRGLMSMHRCLPSSDALSLARMCGDKILADAREMERGIGWVPRGEQTVPLAGFSHGAAGIAWSLLELAALSNEERYRKAALAAIAYERSLFSVEAGNWPDLRVYDGKPGGNGSTPFTTTWCHGAPGIGLARVGSLQHVDDPLMRDEVEIALNTTLAEGFYQNHSLCHGDLGNLELLLQASETYRQQPWRAEVDRIAAIILDSMSRYGWLCGLPLGVESPGLMTGLAGIGYGLLRLADPSRVPSVLLLSPPPIGPPLDSSR